jgi:hypothetical protein
VNTYAQVRQVFYLVANRWLPQHDMDGKEMGTWLNQNEVVAGYYCATAAKAQLALHDLVANNEGLKREDFRVESAWAGIHAVDLPYFNLNDLR